MSKIEIKAPMPGTFYRRPSPESDPFKTDGDEVANDDTVGLIEVMKSFHEIKAGQTGTNIRFVAEDGEAIMAGQVLAEIEG